MFFFSSTDFQLQLSDPFFGLTFQLLFHPLVCFLFFFHVLVILFNLLFRFLLMWFPFQLHRFNVFSDLLFQPVYLFAEQLLILLLLLIQFRRFSLQISYFFIACFYFLLFFLYLLQLVTAFFWYFSNFGLQSLYTLNLLFQLQFQLIYLFFMAVYQFRNFRFILQIFVW